MVITSRHATFIGAFSLAAMTCVGAAAVVNYFVDPAHLFDASHSVETTAASLLVSHDVGGMTNYDERLLQKYRLDVEPFMPRDFLVMGSSRSMQLRADLLQGEILNLSVSGATIEDYVAILDLAAKVPVRTVILGTDPWLFNVNSDQSRWKSLDLEYRRGLANLGMASSDEGVSGGHGMNPSRLLQLINSGYTMASMQSLWQSLRGEVRSRPAAKPDDSPEALTDVIRRDGSRVYSLKFANRPADEIRRLALAEGDPPVYSLNRYFTIDANRLAILRALIRRLKQRSDVWLFLPPYHPGTYDKIVRNLPIILEVERTLRQLAEEEHVRLLGSFDPRQVRCSDADFFDSMHSKDSCLKRVFTH